MAGDDYTCCPHCGRGRRTSVDMSFSTSVIADTSYNNVDFATMRTLPPLRIGDTTKEKLKRTKQTMNTFLERQKR